MNIKIQRNETNVPIEYNNIESAYTKGPLFCVMFIKDGKRQVHKYPIDSIFRIEEDYYKEEKKQLLQEGKGAVTDTVNSTSTKNYPYTLTGNSNH